MEIKFFKKQKKFKKGGWAIKPDLYWGYILAITFLFILLFCIFGLYLFIKVNKEPISFVPTVSDQEIIKKEKLDKVLEYFSEREKKSEEILNSPSPIVDPSI